MEVLKRAYIEQTFHFRTVERCGLVGSLHPGMSPSRKRWETGTGKELFWEHHWAAGCSVAVGKPWSSTDAVSADFLRVRRGQEQGWADPDLIPLVPSQSEPALCSRQKMTGVPFCPGSLSSLDSSCL